MYNFFVYPFSTYFYGKPLVKKVKIFKKKTKEQDKKIKELEKENEELKKKLNLSPLSDATPSGPKLVIKKSIYKSNTSLEFITID